MNREEILASGVYLVATMTPPEIVCPDWCDWTADQHRAELYQSDGEVNHASKAVHVNATADESRASNPPFLEILVAQSTLPDGTPSPLDEVNHGQVVLNIQGMEFAAEAAWEIGFTILTAISQAATTPPVEVAAGECPSWCQTGDSSGLRGPEGCIEHWSNPGHEPWPFVRATGWRERGTPELAAHPIWAVHDGLSRGVGLWFHSDELDETADMTPDEAIALGLQLLRAARAVKAG